MWCVCVWSVWCVCVCGVCMLCVVCVCGVCMWCVWCVYVYVVCGVCMVCVCGVCVRVCVSHVSGDSGVCVCVCVCVCVLKLLRYDTMSCLPIVSDRAATEGSKYFELGRQPHEFLTRNTCYGMHMLGGRSGSEVIARALSPSPQAYALVSRYSHNSYVMMEYPTYYSTCTPVSHLFQCLINQPCIHCCLGNVLANNLLFLLDR